MNTYQVWAEGYAATGERGTATLMGSAKGETFKDACYNLLYLKPSYDSERNSFWACRLYDNEKEARKSFK